MPRQRLVIRIFRENIGIKIFSLVVSLVLFASVRGSGDAQRVISVEVAIIPPASASRRILLTDLPDTVRVTLSGRTALLNRLSREPLPPVQVDLRDTSRHFYAFNADSFTLPAGVTAVQISPASIDLEWANREDKRVPVVPFLSGRVTIDGYEVRRPLHVDPSTVVVSGPASEIGRIQQVQTEPIEVNTFSIGAHSLAVPLEHARQHVTYSDEGQVNVRFEIVAETEERALRHVLVAAVGGSGHAEIRPARVDIVLRGPRALVRTLDADQVIPTVDLSGLESGTGAVLRPVQVRGLPESVEVTRTNPAELLVAP